MRGKPASYRVLAVLLLGLVLALPRGAGAFSASASGDTPTSPAFAASWAEIDKLVEEGKTAEALPRLDRLLASARTAGDEEMWTRALVRTARIRADREPLADAARFLAAQPRPAGAIYRVVIDLYQAETLVRYLQGSFGEIGRREKVGSADAPPLEAQTQGEIAAAALAAARDAWSLRGELGDLPLSRLALYLTPNNYPAQVRGTLRDALSYRFAELLANPSLASAAGAADAESLDLPALLRGDLGSTDGPGLHPLQERVAVLADLEAWHLAAGRREAALEARITRLRGLYDAFGDGEDRRLIRRELAARLAGFRDIPWWSMGMAVLARLQMQEEEPSHLARAHAAAVAGRDAWPSSSGGERCRAIAAEIEQPEFQLMAMESDGLGRRSLEVRHKNLAAVYFRAYGSALQPALDSQPYDEEVAPLLHGDGGEPVAAWRVDLPATPDFDLHSTWVVPPIEHPGVYLVVASTREDFAAAATPPAAVRIVLGDLVLVSREAGGGIEGMALSGATGEPVPGAALRLIGKDSPPLAAGRTGDDGSFFLSWQGGEPFRVLADSPGGPAGSDSYYGSVPDPGDGVKVSTLIYTDRAIYRPGQIVFWKVLVVKGSRREARFGGMAGRQVTVTLRDASWQEVAARTVATNEFGTAAGEIEIPAGRLLGSWSLEARLDHPSREDLPGSAEVRVEEYKRPTFEVLLDDPPIPLRLGARASLTGRARYYFGLPVTRGQVRWRVVRTPLDPLWRRETPHDERTVAVGTASLGADGKLEIAFSPRPGSGGQSEATYEYRVSAEVTDDGGETREAARSFRLGRAALEGEIASEVGFLPAGRPAFLTVTRRDLDGVPRPGAASWSLYELRQPEILLMPADLPAPPSVRGEDGIAPFRTPGDALSPRWGELPATELALRGWPTGRRLTGGPLRHGANGEAEVRLPALRPGAYRLCWETRDGDGARVEAQRELIVGGARTPLALPAVLAVERARVAVGGTARLLVHSGFPGQAFFLEVWHGGERRERRMLRGGQSPAVIELPIRAADRGGLGFHLLLLRDHQLCDLSATVQVPWDDRELRVSFTTFRDRLRPGAHETWKIAVRPPAGEAPETAAAEVLATMTDRSLELFARWQAPDPLLLYPDRSELPPLGSGLGISPESWVGGQVPARTAATAGTPPPELVGDRLLYDLDSDTMRVGPLVPWSQSQSRTMFAQLIEVTTRAPRLDERRLSTGATVGMAKMVSIPTAQNPMSALEPAPDRPAPAPPPRSNFAETAFWQPHLLTGPDGTATIEFTVPDAVTSWNVFVQAVTRDLRSGTLRKEARSARDLLVRPYLPRFLREGDTARLKVVVTNGRTPRTPPMHGEVTLEITDPETGASLLADFGLDGTAAAARLPFTAAAGRGTSVVFPLKAPRRLGPVAVKVSAVAGDESDGELRPLPVLPSRVHLAQSRFAALHGAERRELRFADLEKNDDPTRIDEQMVVTLDGQLFQGALAALPYLTNYPYECTEQTLNRFLSTGIVSSLFARYPAVAAQAAELAKRPTPLVPWDAADPNRELALEETPFLEAAQGGAEPANGLLQVLDPRIARAQRDDSLARLGRIQLPNGAFPWWPGGPASPYMTAYVLEGMARAAEFGLELPPELREAVRKGWAYVAKEYRESAGKDLPLPVQILLDYAASAYPDPSWMGDALTGPERRQILGAGFAHWTTLPPYLRSLLALTLQRMGRPADARLVFDSVMARAQTTADEGTFWQPEPRSWLWSNDTVEAHAFALRTLLELRPDDLRRHGLVQWLFLNRKLGHWKSTRATAEALYALVHYLQREGELGATESATVRAAGKTATFNFAPAAPNEPTPASRNRQMVIPGDQLVPAHSAVVVEKKTPGFLFASATWHFSTEEPPAAGSGDLFHVSRRYFLRVPTDEEKVLQPLVEGALLKPGDEVEVWLTISSRQAAEYVQLRDPRAAGLEPGAAASGWRWEQELTAYEETRDSAASFFFENLPAGEHTLKYRLRANLAGEFRVGPATLQSMYAPEFVAYSGAAVIRVGEAP
jgi:uncharacterized protein YfaS (alpha-2-macroglobulin family)